MMFGHLALEKLLREPGVHEVLDVGSGEGLQAALMQEAGMDVTTISLLPPADFIGDYADWKGKPVDAIWACHVLEHQLNPGLFLAKCFKDLKSNGVLAVTVPPAKHEIVGGHVSLWNAGLVLYHLVMAGFDCTFARVKCYGYNVSVIVRKERAVAPKDLKMDAGDIEKLAHFFPFPVAQGFNGQITSLNWT